jgi:GTP-binding protein
MEEIDQEVPDRRVRYENLPVVVIAGRPNVGKSTLFNRLLHKRRAITDPTPGVTRDPVDMVWELRSVGKRARLYDTGGFKIDKEGLDALVVEKSLAALEKADLIVFLLDAVEVTPEDEEFASLLRRWTPKVLLVVNKADSPERDALIWSHAKWGFEPILYVSAEHGRNMGELEDAIAARLDFSRVVEVEEGREPIRLAIMGKPNTGKSTLLNRLLGEERSIVSEVAGTTRDVVEARFEFKGRPIIVLDTAGIRKKKKVNDNVEYYSVNRAIRTVDESDIVLLMIDAAEGLTDQDKKIAAFAAEKARGLIFVLSKWDTMSELKNTFEASRDKLRYFFGQMAWAPVVPLSAIKGTGIDKLLNTVVSLSLQLNKKVETGRLNRCIADWIEATPPPVGPRTRFKVRYAVQTSINPQKFVVFVSRPEAVAEAYMSFLRNKIRAELSMDQIPVILELKASHARRGDEDKKGAKSHAADADRPPPRKRPAKVVEDAGAEAEGGTAGEARPRIPKPRTIGADAPGHRPTKAIGGKAAYSKKGRAKAAEDAQPTGGPVKARPGSKAAEAKPPQRTKSKFGQKRIAKRGVEKKAGARVRGLKERGTR